MIDAARLAFSQLFTPPFRSVLWKSLGLTLAVLIAVWLTIQGAIGVWLVLPFGWMETIFAYVAGFGLLIGMAFLITPITSLIAGIFLDDIAGVVEATHYPADGPGRTVPLARSIGTSVKFTFVVIAVNLLALFLLLIPGVNIAVFFLANGYLLGREYFELAAMRFHPEADAKELRRRNGSTVFLAGLLIAGMLAVPILNLLTPLFATALMVHVHKQVTGSVPVTVPARA